MEDLTFLRLKACLFLSFHPGTGRALHLLPCLTLATFRDFGGGQPPQGEPEQVKEALCWRSPAKPPLGKGPACGAAETPPPQGLLGGSQGSRSHLLSPKVSATESSALAFPCLQFLTRLAQAPSPLQVR
jgi:hypothetical protein